MKELNDLTDLEICKDIARIEGKKVIMGDGSERNTLFFIDGYSEKYGIKLDHKYNPLTDKALCFDLMVKYVVDFFHRDGTYSASDNKSFVVDDAKPHRAICLAIIAQHRLNGETK